MPAGRKKSSEARDRSIQMINILSKCTMPMLGSELMKITNMSRNQCNNALNRLHCEGRIKKYKISGIEGRRGASAQNFYSIGAAKARRTTKGKERQGLNPKLLKFFFLNTVDRTEHSWDC